MLAFLALFAGFIQVPGVDEAVTHFLDPVFADSPLAAIHPSNTASWIGLAIGGGDLARRDRHRLLPLRRQPGDAAPPAGALLRGPHLPLQQVVLRRGDRHPRRPPGAGDRPLRQQRLRALRHRRRRSPAAPRRRSAKPARSSAASRTASSAPTASSSSSAPSAWPSTSSSNSHDQRTPLAPARRRLRRLLPAQAAGRLVGDRGRRGDAGDRRDHGLRLRQRRRPGCRTPSTRPGSPGSASTTASASTG